MVYGSSGHRAFTVTSTSAGWLVLVAACVLVLLSPANAQTVTTIVPADGTGSFAGGQFESQGEVSTTFTLFGDTLGGVTTVAFTDDGDCATGIAGSGVAAAANSVQASATLPPSESAYAVCIDGVAQGASVLVIDNSSSSLLPLPLEILIIIILLVLSGTFSGLNLGLMALGTTELQIISESGTPNEQQYAKTIMPLRKRGNLLLCTLLLGNVLVNNTLTILLDGLFGGLAAILGATAAIVIFGEIIPQSVCSRYGLWVGAKTIWLTKFFLVLTFPAAYPISLVLDCILGEEIGAVYQRKQLVKLLQLTQAYTDMDKNDVNLVTGALTFKDKTVDAVMTPLPNVFMLNVNSVLDFNTLTRIVDSGHSRIPVFREQRTNIVGVLFFKDLAFVDPDDRIPLESIIKFYNHNIDEVFHDMFLHNLLEQFKKGRSHMVLVSKIVQKKSGDPEREVIGVATLEDVIEEIIQSEIVDETDRYVDNKTRNEVVRAGRPMVQPSMFKDFQSTTYCLSDQLALAAYTYLASQVDPFKDDLMSPVILRRLLAQPDLIVEIKKDTDAEDRILYREGQATSIFTLVLEGRIKVQVGREGFSFAAGPFDTLGVGALSKRTNAYVADFTAEVVSDSAVLFQVRRKKYLGALSASQLGTDFVRAIEGDAGSAATPSLDTEGLRQRAGFTQTPGERGDVVLDIPGTDDAAAAAAVSPASPNLPIVPGHGEETEI